MQPFERAGSAQLGSRFAAPEPAESSCTRSVGQHAAMADALDAPGQHVRQEAADERVASQRDPALGTAVACSLTGSQHRAPHPPTAATEALRCGDYDAARVPVNSNNEVGALGRTFNVMIDPRTGS